MNCLDPNQASELVDGVLDRDQSLAIEAHVADCSECRGLLAALVSGSDNPIEPALSPARPPSQLDKAASPSAFLSAGQALGRFVIEEPIGRGGMGVVYRARDPELDRPVALKLVRFDYSGDRAEEARARLLREARAMAKLSHANVVTVYEVGTHQGHVFIAMELLAGETLQQWVRAEQRDPEQIAEVFAGAGRGLAAAHDAGLVHRDFKPANVIVDAAGQAVVLDFGLVSGEGETIAIAGPDHEDDDSGSVASSSLTRTGVQIGTPAYMAPEQHRGESIGPKSDQFAFGICLYQALAGAHPFPGDNVGEVRARVLAGGAPPLSGKVPARIRRAVARALELDPRDRWPSMAAVVRELERPRPRTWRWLTAGAIAATIASAAFALSRSGAQDLCTGAEQRLAGIWDDETRSAIRKGFASVGLPFASATLTRVEGLVDGYLGRWVSLHRNSCLAGQRGELTEAAMTLQMTCLDRRLREAAAVTRLLRAPERSVVANAETAALALTDLESCIDQSRLDAITPEPVELDKRRRLGTLRESFAQVKAMIDLGRFVEALAQAREDQLAAAELGRASCRERV